MHVQAHPQPRVLGREDRLVELLEQFAIQCPFQPELRQSGPVTCMPQIERDRNYVTRPLIMRHLA